MTKILRSFFIILMLLLITSCSTADNSNIPSDFLFIMDVNSAGDFEGRPVNVNIQIDANGKGRYEAYITDGTIKFDTNHMVTYKQEQVIEKGNFKLNDTQLEDLSDAINENNFFNLTDDYRMAMGFSYAFIVVEANGQRHIVDNIGMEVPEIRAIVEATDSVMPEEISLDYGEGFLPK
jgi:hypothetical protein